MRSSIAILIVAVVLALPSGSAAGISEIDLTIDLINQRAAPYYGIKLYKNADGRQYLRIYDLRKPLYHDDAPVSALSAAEVEEKPTTERGSLVDVVLLHCHQHLWCWKRTTEKRSPFSNEAVGYYCKAHTQCGEQFRRLLRLMGAP